MMYYYDGSHSVTFGHEASFDSNGKLIGKNTWHDWHLIPSSKPIAAFPQAVTKYVEIPGRNGSIDMSEYLTGEPVYGNRTGSWQFIVTSEEPQTLSNLKSAIALYLHNQSGVCILEDDPYYYYVGRFQITWESGDKYSTLTVNYTLEPFKYHISSVKGWLWDPFNFDSDIISNGHIASL